MKKYLFTGFVTLLPIVLTVMIILWLFNLFTAPFAGMIESLFLNYEKSRGLIPSHHTLLVLFLSRLVALIFLFLLILFLGFLGRKYFFNAFLKYADKIFLKIPLVRKIYQISIDMTKAFFSEEKKSFKKTVLIPFPTSNSHALGFVTGEIPPQLQEKILEADLTVFVPTAPYPLSGFLLMTPKKYVIDTDLSIEEGFKFLLSCGIVTPPEKE